MSIVSNYKLETPNTLFFVGDYKTHRGNPSLLRSDSMLKAIGKSVNIRVSSLSASTIPIIVLGNSPISKSYLEKVDYLKTTGIIQGFYNLNPKPTASDFIHHSKEKAFITIENEQQLKTLCQSVLSEKKHYFSSMLSTNTLGKIISISAQEKDDIRRGEKFLKMLRGYNE